VPGVVGEWDRVTSATDGFAQMHRRHEEDDCALHLARCETRRIPLLEHQHRVDEPPPAEELARAVAPVLASAREVWLPAGIGRHPDHQLVRDVARRLCPPGASVFLYADLPYAADPSWPRHLKEPWPHLLRHLAPALARSTRDPGWNRWVRHLQVEDPVAFGGIIRGKRLSSRRSREKWRAVSCYASQIDALRLTPEGLRREAWWAMDEDGSPNP
jgi:hypothetical protein